MAHRVICALSGGKASAWCAKWAFDNYPKEDIILYFNDTKWEHEDLYRFLDDLSKYFDHPITYDNDGRSPEALFYDHRALANNRMPFCSHELKAERLQKFYRHGDTIVFGIGLDEPHRAKRIIDVYESVGHRKKRYAKLAFPLISEGVTPRDINKWLHEVDILEPLLYRLGFKHNNCAGGCVRSGKGQWKLLLEKLPEIYAERERVEEEMREYLGKPVTYLKDISLKELRYRIESDSQMSFDFDVVASECIGICTYEN